MSAKQKAARPRQGATAFKSLYLNRNSTTRTVPYDWRGRLPTPASYYTDALPDLRKPNATGWTLAKCPLHDDKHASLSVNVAADRGGFTCFACGAKGDLLSFHMQRTGLDFRAAVRDLLGLAS